MAKNIDPSNKPNKPGKDSALRSGVFWIFIFLGVVWVLSVLNVGVFSQIDKLRYDQFYYLVEHNLETPTIKSVKLTLNYVEGDYLPEYSSKTGKTAFQTYIPEKDRSLIPLLRTNVSEFTVEPPRTALINFFISIFPVLVFIGFLWY